MPDLNDQALEPQTSRTNSVVPNNQANLLLSFLTLDFTHLLIVSLRTESVAANCVATVLVNFFSISPMLEVTPVKNKFRLDEATRIQ